MNFIKKNLLFVIVVTFCLLAFAGGTFMAFREYGKVAASQRALEAAGTRLSSLSHSEPAPNEANLEAAERNLEQLRGRLAAIRADLQRGADLSITDDGVSVITGIQQYIQSFQRLAAGTTYTNDEGVEVPIALPKDFAFGFQKYFRDVTPPDDPAKAALLDKQRQILAHLLEQLIASNPQSIEAVQREVFEAEESQGGFFISPAISVRVPGAIDTLAFSVTFTGYTDSLRNLLNRLAAFELPIIVSSIEVERPSGSETIVVPAGRNDVGSIFDLIEGGTQEDEEWPKPVIVDNVSRFTVIVEFIEVVLPDAQNKDVSDPA